MATNSSYLYLKPVEWSQKVRRYPSLNVEGPHSTVTCTSRNNSDLLLSDGYKLSDLQIELAVFQGELRAKYRGSLPDQAIGGIWWIPEQAFVHGWFYLNADDFAAVWDQVRDGGYVACGIVVGVGRVQYTKNSEFAWSGNPVSIETAEVYFKRETIPKDPANDATKEKGLTWTKRWALALFVMAATGWLFPQWNGAFFEPSKDVTTGEGRIVAAVLFVGGLLLWFLGSPRPSGRVPTE
jgi:hypothetical protein